MAVEAERPARSPTSTSPAIGGDTSGALSSPTLCGGVVRKRSVNEEEESHRPSKKAAYSCCEFLFIISIILKQETNVIVKIFITYIHKIIVRVQCRQSYELNCHLN